jgi:hypothetical protein
LAAKAGASIRIAALTASNPFDPTERYFGILPFVLIHTVRRIAFALHLDRVRLHMTTYCVHWLIPD